MKMYVTKIVSKASNYVHGITKMYVRVKMAPTLLVITTFPMLSRFEKCSLRLASHARRVEIVFRNVLTFFRHVSQLLESYNMRGMPMS